MRYINMTSDNKQKNGTRKSRRLRIEYVIFATELLFCCVIVGGDSLSAGGSTTTVATGENISTYYDKNVNHNIRDSDSKNSDIEDEDGMTANDMLMYGIGGAAAFDNMESNVGETTNFHSTSESSLSGLASIAGGFDHASFDPQYEYAVTDHTTTTLDDRSNGYNTSSDYSPAKVWFHQKIQRKIKCGHLTIMEDGKRLYTIKVAEPCRFWTEGVVSAVVAIFGFMGNLISIWVLSDDELRSSPFNRLLLALAMIDCMFIIPGTVIYTAKAFAWEAEWYHHMFPVFLYPFTEIALCSSIYMTVAIAVERYIGLCRPFQRLSGSCSAKTYITPVVIIAVLLNIPKFFESETTFRTDKRSNTTVTSIGVTSLRLHPDYITYYWMWTRLLTTGVIPFLLLALLNSKIYLAIRKSKQQLRALAIRSALPMAILGAKNAAGATAGVSPSETLVPELAGITLSSSLLSTPSDNGHINGNNGTRKSIPGATENSNASITPKVIPQSPPSRNCSPISPKNILYLRNGEGTIVNGSSPLPSSPLAQGNGSPRSSTSSPRFIQRSMSALVSSDTNNRQIRHSCPSRNGSNDSTALGRSYSTAATVSNAVTTNSQQTQTPANNPLSNYNNNDNLAPILFGVVIVFVICNSLRVILNIYDSAVVEDIIECEKQKMGRYPPAWILCTISVSHFLLMVNSSVNFLVYCVAGKRFRSILAKKIRKKFRAFRKVLYCCCGKRKRQSYLSTRSQNQITTSKHLNNQGSIEVFGYKDNHRHVLLKHSSSPNTLLSLQNPQRFTEK